MRLYEHPESGNSHKIRLLLSFLGLEYESVVVDLMTDEQHQEPFLSINPRGVAPACKFPRLSSCFGCAGCLV